MLEIVRLDIGAVSRQAVYDSLNLSSRSGLLRRIQPVGSSARYEDRVNDNHHHLICRICGDVVDVDCAVGAAPCLEASDDLGYEIDEAEVAFWGRCPRCQRGESNARRRLDPRSNRRHQKSTIDEAKVVKRFDQRVRDPTSCSQHKRRQYDRRKQVSRRGRLVHARGWEPDERRVVAEPVEREHP